MCMGCWEEYGRPTAVTDRATAGAAAVAALYEVHGAGGYMHIVTDDWNIDDDDVAWCVQSMADRRHDRDADEVERECGRVFADMTVEERAVALAIVRGFLRAGPALPGEGRGDG